MGYLGVNIHGNIVILAGTGINEEGNMVLKLSSKVNQDDMFAAFDEGATVEADTNDLKIWGIKVLDWEQKPKASTAVSQDLINLKLNLVDILAVYMPEEKAKAVLGANVMFAGLGITAATQGQLPQMLVQQSFVDAVYKNICNAFTTAMTPYFGTNPFRIKLRRQNKKKHYPMIPPRSKFNEVWIEPMLVPAEASKIAWSDYELKNGLNSGVKEETTTAAPEDKKKVDNMFAAPEAGGVAPGTAMAAPVNAPVTPPTQEMPTAPPTQPADAAGFAQPATPAAAPEAAVNPFNTGAQ